VPRAEISERERQRGRRPTFGRIRPSQASGSPSGQRWTCQIRGRNDPVVRTQYRRPKPSDVFRTMSFWVAYRHSVCLLMEGRRDRAPGRLDSSRGGRGAERALNGPSEIRFTKRLLNHHRARPKRLNP